MTDPEGQEREQAQQEAEKALNYARGLRDRSVKIGAGWIQSREDNNFRLMLRNLGRGETPRAS